MHDSVLQAKRRNNDEVPGLSPESPSREILNKMSLVTPDIIHPSQTVSRERLLGWTPEIVNDGIIDDRERLKRAYITPAEMALQLAFGIYNHNAPKNRKTKYHDLFENQHLVARKQILGMGSHEIGYVMAIALWANRDVVIDYGSGYGSYAAHFDGYSRRMLFTSADDLSNELYRNIDTRYIIAINNGCKSIEELARYEDEIVAKELESLGDTEGAMRIRELHDETS